MGSEWSFHTLRNRLASGTKPITAKIASNERESRALAALRGALLPKLISGELRVSESMHNRELWS